MTPYSHAEQQVANSLFLRHGAVLDKGYVDGVDVGFDVNEMRTGSDRMYGYWKRGTGKYQVRVGPQFNDNIRTVGFKQLKEGGHSYDKIADKMMEIKGQIVQAKARRDAERKRESENSNVRKQLADELNVAEFNSNLTINYPSGVMTFRVGNLNEDQARQFMQLGIDLGIIKQLETK